MKIQNLEISKRGYLLYNGYELDSIFYSIQNIPWQVFLSLHFTEKEYAVDSVEAEKNRRSAVQETVWGARRALGLAQNDLIHISNSEKQNGRCHTHALIYSKEKARVHSETLLYAIKANAPWDILSLPTPSSEKKAFSVIRDSKKTAAYYSKHNKNDIKLRSDYIPKIAKSFLLKNVSFSLS